MKISLFTNWYKSYRDEENEICLQKNLMNSYIDKVYLICDDGKEFPTHEKITGIRCERATYNDFFKFINDSDPDVSIVSNSDIYFDSSISYAKFLKEDSCYALTRWDEENDDFIFYNRSDSQDAWVFKGKIKDVEAPFHSGRLACDNRLAYELKRAGYLVSNPSKTIYANHLHIEDRLENENHDQSLTIPPPYLYVDSTEIVPFMSIVTRHYYKRPNMFKICCDSVSIQKDPDFDHIIIKDSVGVGSHQANQMFFKNKESVTGKYVFMLDDDDTLITDKLVGDIRKIAEEYDPELIFIRMWLNDCVYPTEVDWMKDKLEENHIGTSCVVVKNNLWQDNIEKFLPIQTGDFHFINSVFSKRPKVYWHDKFYSRTQRVSAGAPE